MMLLLLLLLLSIPEEIVGIECVHTDTTKEWLLDDFNYEKFRLEIDGYPSYDYTDNSDMCRVEIFVDYQSRLLIISFADSFEWSQLVDGEGRFDFLIVLNQSSTEVEYYNVLEYACNDQNKCDKLFVFKNIDWLQQINYTIFQTHLRSLLFNNSNQIEYCFTDKINSGKCSNGICSGKYSTHFKTYSFECQQNSETVEVLITTSMTVEENLRYEINVQQQQIIRYTCQYNLCNNQLLTDSLVKIVENHFELGPMKEALIQLYQQTNNHPRSNHTFQVIFQTTSTTETIPFNIANNSFYISINLFFILLFISFDI